MGRRRAEEQAEPKESADGSSCHGAEKFRATILICHPDGRGEAIGSIMHCGAQLKKDGFWDACNKPQGGFKRFRAWPEDLSEAAFRSLAEKGPGYWTEWGFWLARDRTGNLHNFNQLDTIPQGPPGTWTPQAKAMIRFRSEFDNPLKRNLEAVAAAAIHSSTEKHHRAQDGYQPDMDALEDPSNQI